jgi:nitrite reductase [NAD(P)H] small subunit
MNALSDWVDIGAVEEVPVRGSRTVKAPGDDIAIFKSADGSLFAVRDRCPHRGGPLSQGIVHGTSVTCPLHNWVISLETGEVQGPDVGCVKTIPLAVRDGRILLSAAALGRKVA